MMGNTNIEELQAPESGKKQKKRKKRIKSGTLVFWALFELFTAAAVIAVTLGLNKLWDFLEDYEVSLPEKVVESVVDSLERGDTEKVYDSTGFAPNIYEDDSAAREYVAGLFKGELTYSKDIKNSTDESPVYYIKCNGNKVCSLTLEQSGEQTDWGFPLYKSAGFSGVEVPTGEITITAPDNAEIRINGIAMLEKPVKSEPIEACGYFYNYIDKAPAMVEYTLTGFTQTPEVTAVREDGIALDGTAQESKFTFNINGGDPPEELAELALNASKAYTKFISADAAFSAVAKFVPADVPFYSNVSTYNANFYTPHNRYDFLDVSVGDYLWYTQDCVSLRVKYTHAIYGYYGSFEFPTDYTVYLAQNNTEWLVTDIVMN